MYAQRRVELALTIASTTWQHFLALTVLFAIVFGLVFVHSCKRKYVLLGGPRQHHAENLVICAARIPGKEGYKIHFRVMTSMMTLLILSMNLGGTEIVDATVILSDWIQATQSKIQDSLAGSG